MKKLFFIVTTLVFVVTLSACGAENGTDASETEALEDRVNALEDTVSDQREKTTEMENVISGLETAVNEDKVVFTVDTGEETLARTAPYQESSEMNAFELLDLVYDVDYTESDDGIFLEDVESLDALEGSFIGISKNGEMIDTGLAEASFEGGDHFHFERSWWDEDLEALNQAVELFVENQAESYIEDGDYHVALGLHHLGYDSMLESMDVPELASDPSDGELIQHILVSEVLDEDASQDRADLADQASTDYPYSAALSYLALATGDEVDDAFETDFKAMLDGLDIDSSDRPDDDSLSMVLAALGAMDDSDYDPLEDDIVTHLEDNLYAESNDENDPGVNAAGLAASATALLAVGEDPTMDAFVHDDSDLVQNLLAYQNPEGAFRYKLDDEDAETEFSTPQAFFALAAYQASLNDTAFTHPFRVD